MLRGTPVTVLGNPNDKDKADLQKMIDEHFGEGCQCILEEAGDDDGEGDAYIVIDSDQCPEHNGEVMLVDKASKPTMEPFGQRFAGIVDTYPELSKAIVEQAKKDIEVRTQLNEVVLHLRAPLSPYPFDRRTITILPAEYAYVLFMELKHVLFGSNPNASFKAKE